MAAVRTQQRGPAYFVGLNRPDQRNALNQVMAAELGSALAQAAAQPCVLVVHSTTPGIFAAGADAAERAGPGAAADLRAVSAGLLDRLEAHRWPTVALVDGAAYGSGCELALACDLRLASPAARFAQPEPDLGILAGAGGSWRLTQLAGLAVARRMLYVGAELDADAALAAGLVDAVHPADGLMDAAAELAGRIAARSWRAVELTKLALRLPRPATTTFDLTAQALLSGGADQHERTGRFPAEQPRRRRTPAEQPGRAARRRSSRPGGCPRRRSASGSSRSRTVSTWRCRRSRAPGRCMTPCSPSRRTRATGRSPTAAACCSVTAAWARPPGWPGRPAARRCWT